MKAIIIIPTYNEQENIGILLQRIFTLYPDIRVMVVDDNSPDGTAATVEEMMKTNPRISLYKRPGKLGLSSAYTEAFQKILTGTPDIEAIVTMDSDFSHDPLVVGDLLEKLSKYDLAIGSRYTPGGRLENWPWHRIILSRAGNTYARMVLNRNIRDLTAGFMAFRATLLREPAFRNISANGFAFLMEIKIIASSLGASIIEIPITFKDRVNGYSKISNKIISEGLIMPWRLRTRYRKVSQKTIKK